MSVMTLNRARETFVVNDLWPRPVTPRELGVAAAAASAHGMELILAMLRAEEPAPLAAA